jgi:hypothetical protein
MPSSSFGNNIAPPLQGSQASQGTYYSTYSSTKKNLSNPKSTLLPSQSTCKAKNRENYTVQGKNLTLIARKRIDVARRLFKMFDKDENGYLTEGEIPSHHSGDLQGNGAELSTESRRCEELYENGRH